MFELIAELLAEIVLQVGGEIVAELLMRATTEPFRGTVNPWLAALGYGLYGALAGGLSLLFFPHHLIGSQLGQLVGLVLTPVSAGAVMAGIGALRARRGAPVLRIDSFFYGYLFALAFTLVRFWYTRG